MVSYTVFVDAITSTDLFNANKRLLLHLKQRWKVLFATNACHSTTNGGGITVLDIQTDSSPLYHALYICRHLR